MTGPTASRPPPPTRSEFGYWWTATTRWADMDGFGHMNNARYFELVDTAIDRHLMDAIGGPVDSLGAIGVFAEVSCRFFRELTYPGSVDLGVTVDRVGRSSIGYRVGLFQESVTGSGPERAAAAESRVVMVYVENAAGSRRVVPLPEVVRAAAESLRSGHG